MSKLVLFLPDGTTLDVPLDRERISIGRRLENDLCLPNLAVSGEHAVVVTILADSFLEDLNSTNGTLVNGDAIAKHFLHDRDEIDIGRHRLVYCADDGAMPTSKKLEGMARVHERDFGGRVETAKPYVRPRDEAIPEPSAEARQPDPEASRPAPGGARSSQRGGAARGSGRAPRQTEPALELPQMPPEKEPEAPVAPPEPIRGPAVRLLTGLRAGAATALAKDETTLGRPGFQVVAIVRSEGGFRVKPVEGISPPTLNGQPVPPDGAELKPGDVIEIVGTRVEFFDPTAATAVQSTPADSRLEP